MTPQELKNSILQLAIKGKLVEQRPEEGTVEELYQQIQAEKQKLIKAGTIKKEKPLPDITEDEKPFDIPVSWKFVHLDDIVQKNIKRGKSPTYTASSDTLVFAQKCNVKTGGINMALAQYLDESTLRKYPEEEFMSHMDIVVNSTGNGTLGRIGLFRDSDNPTNQQIVPDSHVTVIRVNSHLLPEYAFYFLKSCQPYLESMGSGSTNQTELKPYVLRSLVVPLPPLAEQKRIVAKIEELLPYIDRYEQAWSKLEDFNKRFPTDMQKSILQFAIQGKMVEQRPEEGTGEELYWQIQAEKAKLIKEGKIKKEKPLPEITNGEIPFDIPESWKWVHMGELFYIHSSKRIHANEYVSEGAPFFRSLEVVSLAKGIEPEISFYISHNRYKELCKDNVMPRQGDLLITCIGGSIGWSWIVDDRTFYYKDGNVVAFDGHENFDMTFLQSYLSSPLFLGQVKKDVSGTAYNALTIEMLKSYIIPLPPLSEQKRIVTKLEEILPLCEMLK